MAKEKKVETKEDMSLEEARAYRASLYKPQAPVLTEEAKREAFRIFWAQNKKVYGKDKELESVLWIHLKSAGFAEPEKFDSGIAHFGLKKIK